VQDGAVDLQHGIRVYGDSKLVFISLIRIQEVGQQRVRKR
jgi:hypothetical protein